MEENIKNILIVGKGAVASALAKKLKQNSGIEKIFVAPGNGVESDSYFNIDLREEDLTGLLKFVLEHEIDLTVPVSERALKSDIVSFFLSNGQNIFGPSKQACNIAINKASGKKFIYRLRAQTSRFGIFDKAQAAEEYLSNATFPVTIRTYECSSILDDMLVCPTMSIAKEFLSNLTLKNETDILVDEYTFGQSFTLYFITDGYSAVELTSVANYKFTQDGNSGILTNGIGAIVPSPFVSQNVMERVRNIVVSTLNILERKGSPYVGILGVEGIYTYDDKFYISEFKPFLQEHDAAAVLKLVDDDLIRIFKACIDGYFADEYEMIKMNDYTSVSATVLSCKENKVVKGLEMVEDFEDIDFSGILKSEEGEYVTSKGEVFTISRMASTLSRARDYLYEDLGQIQFDGIKYRKDIASEYRY